MGTFTNSEDQDEMLHNAAFHQMPHNAAFHQGLHYLSR